MSDSLSENNIMQIKPFSDPLKPQISCNEQNIERENISLYKLEEWEKPKHNPLLTVDEHIDLLATKTALGKEGIIDNLVNKKADELETKADVKVAMAQSNLAKAKTNNIIADSDKAQAFFDANRQVLGIIGIKDKLGYKTMTSLFPFALVLFLFIAILIYFPLSLAKYITTFFIDIVGDVSKKVATNVLKILFGILATALTSGILFAIYYFLFSLQ